jgi:hypothetical protein
VSALDVDPGAIINLLMLASGSSACRSVHLAQSQRRAPYHNRVMCLYLGKIMEIAIATISTRSSSIPIPGADIGRADPRSADGAAAGSCC